MQALDHVAPDVVREVRAGVVLHQVVQDGGDVVDRPGLLGDRCHRVQDVAGRIEGERLGAQSALRLQQPTHRIVAIAQAIAAAVADVSELAGPVVGVLAADAQRRGVRGRRATALTQPLDAAENLRLQAPRRVVLLLLRHLVGLRALDLAVQVVPLDLQGLHLIKHQAMHMARAVGQPGGGVTVGARGLDAVAQFVVAVLPDRRHRLAAWLALVVDQVVMVLGTRVAGGIVEPLQLDAGVPRIDEPAVAVVGVVVCLNVLSVQGTPGRPALAVHGLDVQRRAAPQEPPHRIELQLCERIAFVDLLQHAR
ncbi:hypothetical protein D9M72_317570 [compost metagenome]